MKDHIKILAWIYIVLGGLGLFGTLITFFAIAGGGLISGDQEAIRITLIVAFAVSTVMFICFVPGILAGIGLLGLKPWARILTIILGLLNLPGFPVGTLLGIYSLWALLDNESSLLFTNPA
jgi:hypothetical protein